MKDLWKDREFSPMLLKEVDKPFNSKEHIFEINFDGIRAVILIEIVFMFKVGIKKI